MKVFLSSTAVDLTQHRSVADDTILRLSQQPIAMERFGPLPGTPVAECEQMARECDVLICLVAHRYGFVPEKGKGSITRREVEAAKTSWKDVLVWIVDEKHPWTEKKEQDLLTDPAVLADPARIAEVAAGVQQLLEFKLWLQSTFICETFTTPDDLGKKIAIALGKYGHKHHGQTAVSTVPALGEIRVVHPLQPAPHFQGRLELLGELQNWVADVTSPDRVWSLVAAGGTGKTAVAQQLVANMQPGKANVLVWSFYESPDADAFLRECAQLFLGEEEGAAGGRLERLERGLRDGRPHLIVLDGLELVQHDGESGRVRGELTDHTLKLLLRALANGLGRTRALVTSRFPLVDLQGWAQRGYQETRLEDLSPKAAVAVLRGWDVSGTDQQLEQAAEQVGFHALSVSVIGSYLQSFAEGRIESVSDFHLETVTGHDPKAAKLARVLAYYANRLPSEERELLVRLSVFPNGVTHAIIDVVIDAGGEVAGLLGQARQQVTQLLNRLKERGLVFRYEASRSVRWTAHPFLRESFRKLLGCPPERVFGAIADSLSAGLHTRPAAKPIDPVILDQYERLIEATRLAGRVREAFDLYWFALGNYRNLGWILGEYERGYRILAAFDSMKDPSTQMHGIELKDRSNIANDLSLYAMALGHLDEAECIRVVDDKWATSIRDGNHNRIGLVNSSHLAASMGNLHKSRERLNTSLDVFDTSRDAFPAMAVAASLGMVNHYQGDIDDARRNFGIATHNNGGHPLSSIWGAFCIRHYLDLTQWESASALIHHGMNKAQTAGDRIAIFHALQARLLLAKEADPTPHINKVRNWTCRTGHMELMIEAHLLSARHLLSQGDLEGALGEVDGGLLHAETCGYRLLQIELLVTLAEIRLRWPDAPAAIQAARTALDLATAPECGYAWGAADAAQVWGEAYFANHERELALRAFTQAHDVRKRIEHPRLAETEKWLARVRG